MTTTPCSTAEKRGRMCSTHLLPTSNEPSGARSGQLAPENLSFCSRPRLVSEAKWA